MKMKLILFVVLVGLVIVSCQKAEEFTPNCDFTAEKVTILPVCDFKPKAFPNTKVPVAVNYSDIRISSGYTFDWGGEFQGSARGVAYNDLPITVTITQDSTNCKVVKIIEKNNWD